MISYQCSTYYSMECIPGVKFPSPRRKYLLWLWGGLGDKENRSRSLTDATNESFDFTLIIHNIYSNIHHLMGNTTRSYCTVQAVVRVLWVRVTSLKQK